MNATMAQDVAGCQPPAINLRAQDLVAGRCRVDADWFDQRIGETARDVLAVYWRCRDAGGWTHVTQASVARKVGGGITRKTVERATARLRALGLIGHGRWVYRRVPQGARTVTRKVYVRHVVGELESRYHVRIPAAVKQRLEKPRNWGGRRTPAGGRPTRREVEARQHARAENQDGGAPVGKNQDGGASGGKMGDRSVLSRDLASPPPSGEEIQIARAGARARTDHLDRATPALDVVAIDRRVVESPSSAQPNAGVLMTSAEDTKGRERVQGFELDETRRPGTPLPFPGVSLIHAPRRPPMPKLRADMSDRDKARMLARAYRAAVGRFADKRTWAFAKGEITRSKHYRALLEAAKVLERHDAAPIHWFAWATVQWNRMRKNPKGAHVAPPLAWALKPAVLDKYEGAAYYEPRGRVTPGQDHIPAGWNRDLHARFAAMEAELCREGAMPFTELAEGIQRKHFPGDSFAQAVTEMRRKAADMTAHWYAAAERGEWVWL